MRLSQGAIFGELALMQDSPRTATVIIVENAILMSLDKQSFQKFIKVKDFVKKGNIKRE